MLTHASIIVHYPALSRKFRARPHYSRPHYSVPIIPVPIIPGVVADGRDLLLQVQVLAAADRLVQDSGPLKFWVRRACRPCPRRRACSRRAT